MEPYKLLLGLIIRKNCVSISVSNPYLSLAEPVGAIMLRDGGKVPMGALKRLLTPHAGELAGVVLGVLHGLSPGLPGTWWEKWTPATPASSRLDPAPGPGSAPSGASSTQVAPPQAQGSSGSAQCKPESLLPGMGESGGVAAAQESGGAPEKAAPVCSVATLFLQHYLDGLGSANTFG
ncbi:MAG: hypothetical protein WDW38_004795 [Sanguina aurantia]